MALHRDQRVRDERVRRLVPRRGYRADARGQPRDPRLGRGTQSSRVLQSSRRHRLVRPAPQARLGEAARHQVLVPRQRDGRSVADGAQDRRRVRPDRGGDGQDDEVGRSHDRARRLRLDRAHHGDLRNVGEHGPRARVRPHRLHLAPHLPQQLRRRHRGFPRQPRSHGRLHRGGRRDGRCGRGAPPVAQAAHAEPRRVERVVPHAPPRRRGSHAARLARRAAGPRGGLHHGGRARLRRRVHRPPQPCRPRQGGVPRAAGQRDRADHDRDGRAGVEADDLLSLRGHEQPGQRARAPGAHRQPDL